MKRLLIGDVANANIKKKKKKKTLVLFNQIKRLFFLKTIKRLLTDNVASASCLD